MKTPKKCRKDNFFIFKVDFLQRNTNRERADTMFKPVHFTFATISVLILSACSTPQMPPSSQPSTPDAPAPAKPVAAGNAREVSTVTAAVDPLLDPKGPLAKRSIYFAFDEYLIRPDFMPTLTAHANYLQGKPGRKLIIQGNADERGSSEYNLALGQKRAEAVKRALQGLGLNEARMEAISFGKEKPKALGHDEAAWAENRRADLFYPQ